MPRSDSGASAIGHAQFEAMCGCALRASTI